MPCDEQVSDNSAGVEDIQWVTYLPCLTEVEREAELPADGVLELDGRLVLLVQILQNLGLGFLLDLLLEDFSLLLLGGLGFLGSLGRLTLGLELLARFDLCLELGLGLELFLPFGQFLCLLGGSLVRLLLGLLRGFNLFALGLDRSCQLLFLLLDCRRRLLS